MADASGTSREAPSLPPVPDIRVDDLLKIYRVMLVARSMDERCLSLQRQGRIGFYAPMQGQEAAQIGCTWALDPTDWILPAYRELGVALVRGIPLKLLFDQFIGNADDRVKGRQMPNHYGYPDYRYVSISSPVGTQITHAVGAAMAAQRRQDPIVTITFFGDGTTSSNDFHAGLNFAGVFQTPTIFFCQNNQWAISVPREHQTRSETLAMKASSYGFPGSIVDGNDVHSVYRAVSEARARALAGQGPTLIEAQVMRLGPHSTSDDPKRYRTEEQLAPWREKDPVRRLRQELIEAGLLTEATDRQMVEEVKAEIASALQAAEAAAPIDPMTLFDDVFQERPAGLEAERAKFAERYKMGEIHQ